MKTKPGWKNCTNAGPSLKFEFICGMRLKKSENVRIRSENKSFSDSGCGKFQIQQTKTKTELFRLRLTIYPISAFETGKCTCFQTAARNTVLCQPIKFWLRFFLFEFGIVSGKNAAGKSGYGAGERTFVRTRRSGT